MVMVVETVKRYTTFRELGLFLFWNGNLIRLYDDMQLELNDLENSIREIYRFGYVFKDFNEVEYDLEGLLKRCQYLYKYS